MEFFDLTRPLVAGMPVLDGDPSVTLARTLSYEANGYAVTRISLGSHSGTHLDAPRHFYPDGATLDQYSVDRFVRPGVVVDVRPATAAGAVEGRSGRSPQRGAAEDSPPTGGDPAGPATIDAPLLAERLRLYPVQPGGFVLLWTEGALFVPAAAQLLLDTGAGLVGTDAPSLDEEPYPVHRLLLGRGVLIAENL